MSESATSSEKRESMAPSEDKAEDVSTPAPAPPPPDTTNHYASYMSTATPSGWSAMSRMVREVDEQKIQDYKEDIDTILVFAGLFSAVMTAFLVESYQSLSPDPSDVMIALMQQMVLQTHSYTFTNGLLNSTAPLNLKPPEFQPTLNAVRVNILWFASLVLSLISASFGILVKQWLREYLAGEYTSPHARLRVRHFRNPGLADWKVFEIAGLLPLMLQLALALFLIGLCFFTADIHATVGHTTLPLVAGWAFLFVAALSAPALSPRCPYKTPLLKFVMKKFRKALYHSILAVRSLQNLSTENHMQMPRKWTYHLLAYDEEQAAADDKNDTNILIEVDSIQADEHLLTFMWTALQPHADPGNSVAFLLTILGNRLQRNLITDPSPSLLDLRRLPKSTVGVIMDCFTDVLGVELSRQSPSSNLGVDEWTQSMKDCVYVLLSRTDSAMTGQANRVLSLCLSNSRHKSFADFITSRIDDIDALPYILQRLQGAFSGQIADFDILAPLHSLFQAHFCLNHTSVHSGLIDLVREHKADISPACMQQLISLVVDCVIKQSDIDGTWHYWYERAIDLALELAPAASHHKVFKLARFLIMQSSSTLYWSRWFIGLNWPRSQAIRDAAEAYSVEVYLSSDVEDRRAILVNFADIAKWSWHRHPEAEDSDHERCMRLDPVAAVRFQLRLLKLVQEQGQVFNDYDDLLKKVWATLYEPMRTLVDRGIKEHPDQAKGSLMLIQEMEPGNVDDHNAQTFEDWAKSFNVEESFVPDELVGCLAAFVPPDEATFCARVRRWRLMNRIPSPSPDTGTTPPDPSPTNDTSTVNQDSNVVHINPSRSNTHIHTANLNASE